MPLQETLKHSKAGLAQSLVGSLGPGAHKVLFVPSKSLFPRYYGNSVIKFHWPPMSNSLGDPQVEKSVVGPRTLLTVKYFFGVIVLELVGHLLSDSMLDNTA